MATAFNSYRSAFGLVMLLCGSSFALPACADSAISTAGAGEQPTKLAALLLPLATPSDTGRSALTVGREQSIVGLPVDFDRVTTSAKSLGARKQIGLPDRISMPTALPLSGALLTSRFGLRWHPIRGGLRSHLGIDLAAPAGSPVHVPAMGVVSLAGWDGGYGLSVIVDHGGGLQTRYGHLSRLAVAPGQAVATGAVVGYVGSTGLSTGPHLHYEVRSNGQAVDPLSKR